MKTIDSTRTHLLLQHNHIKINSFLESLRFWNSCLVMFIVTSLFRFIFMLMEISGKIPTHLNLRNIFVPFFSLILFKDCTFLPILQCLDSDRKCKSSTKFISIICMCAWSYLLESCFCFLYLFGELWKTKLNWVNYSTWFENNADGIQLFKRKFL